MVSAWTFPLAPFDEITFQRISRRGSIVQGNQSRYAYQVNRLLTSFNDSVWTLMEGLSV